MTQSEPVAPCPFCGSRNVSDGEILSIDTNGGNQAVQSECLNCGAVGPKGLLAADEIDYGSVKAITAWNRRTTLTDEQIDAVMVEADWPPSLLAPVIKAKLRQFARALLARATEKGRSDG